MAVCSVIGATMGDEDRQADRDLLAQLRATEERYRRIVEATSEGIWPIDAESRTTFANGRLATMLGYTAEELVGEPLETFVSGEPWGLYESAVVRRQRGVAERNEAILKHKDGSTFWASLQVNPFLDAEGRYERALAIVTDITERKQAEAVRSITKSTSFTSTIWSFRARCRLNARSLPVRSPPR